MNVLIDCMLRFVSVKIIVIKRIFIINVELFLNGKAAVFGENQLEGAYLHFLNEGDTTKIGNFHTCYSHESNSERTGYRVKRKISDIWPLTAPDGRGYRA